MDGHFKLQLNAVVKLRRNNDAKREELMKMKEMELSLQKCKETLMERKTQISSSIREQARAVEEITSKLPPASRKLFDQLYPQVNNVYQSELLLLELNQQLMVAMARREETAILKVLQEESYVVGDFQDEKSNHAGETCFLQEWFHQISRWKRQADPDLSPGKPSVEKHRINEDRVFYWAKYETLPFSHGGVLCFSTRHCGMCIRLRIESPRKIAEGIPLASLHNYTITSDVPLDGLQLGLLQSIKENQMAHDFVINTLWRLMENNLLPFI
ncbi:uncharacterized protein LOC117299687 [Asterias rubens]|uniref:uncharacterized protein LOC117299687 n=1 Tax=Asterias rubens TaxID=7604 RepID=UPI0014557D03|nr:uncharacterized protein LOC117299687 [Asterias rubens]